MNLKNKELFLNFLIIIILPIISSLIYIIFILPNYQFDYLLDVYTYHLGGFILNFIFTIIFFSFSGIGFGFFKLMMIFIIKLIIIILYFNIFKNKNKNFKYIIALIISIMGIVSGYFYEIIISSI